MNRFNRNRIGKGIKVMREIDEDIRRSNLPNLGKVQTPKTGDECHCEQCDGIFFYKLSGRVLFAQRFCSRECENRYYEWKD